MQSTYMPSYYTGPPQDYRQNPHIPNNMVYLPQQMNCIPMQPTYIEPIPAYTHVKMNEFYNNTEAPRMDPEMYHNHFRRVYENQDRNIYDTYNYSFENFKDRNNFIKNKVDEDLEKTSLLIDSVQNTIKDIVLNKNQNQFAATAELNKHFYDSRLPENDETIKKYKRYGMPGFDEFDTVRDKDLMNENTRQFIDDNVPHKDFAKDGSNFLNAPEGIHGMTSKPNLKGWSHANPRGNNDFPTINVMGVRPENYMENFNESGMEKVYQSPRDDYNENDRDNYDQNDRQKYDQDEVGNRRNSRSSRYSNKSNNYGSGSKIDPNSNKKQQQTHNNEEMLGAVRFNYNAR